jgi:FKBP-type peptidyl-prolyl cis-trans isomerase
MQKFFSTIAYISVALTVLSCAKTEQTGPNDAYQRYFESWMQINHPNAEASGLGIYIMEDIPGNGVEVGEEGYVLVDYKITDLEGNISSYTDALTAKQLGSYDPTLYYGPKFWTTTKTTLPAGVRDAVVGTKVGTKRTVIIPSWLMSYKDYESEADYLDPPLKKDEEYDASSFSNTIYEFTIKGYTEDMDQWQIDSIGRFFANPQIKVDGTPANKLFITSTGSQMTAADSTSLGFYYKQIKAPVNTEEFASDTTIYINYVGKLLNGLVFDTNIERVAKDNNLYSATKKYEPMQIKWGEEYTDLTMGTDKSSMISGFAKTLWQMKDMEKGVGIFYSNLGYGYSGSGSSIPGYAPLIFEIELVAKPEK